ncbi:MAG: hypothetical protein EKK33_33785 [Bradyrhizobiaceae bacterium]|jgi:hypothetical protein|nr:MAG: hypothetical protein EKK33_33785 [Bradyrhizobiaceae bacterium]
MASFRSAVPFVVAVTVSIGAGSFVPAMAACYAPDQQLPAQTVSDFLGSPAAVLQDAKNAEGGQDMITLVRDLVASNPTTLPVVIGLLDKANPAQQGAIGSALGQAANLCLKPDQAFAGDIVGQLAASSSDSAKNAYAAVTGTYPLRSVAGGGGVSGGASGGTTGSLTTPVGGSSTFAAFSSNSVAGSPGNYFTGSTSSATQRSASNSVSP